jgi:CheY-like chemotaxis protein
MEYQMLIIDDEEIVGMLIKRLVIKSKLHESPIIFQTAQDGINYLESASAGLLPHVILLDINMPKFNGWEFLESLSSMTIHMPVHVVIITSSINTSDRIKASTYVHVVGYFEKPVTLQAMEDIKSIDIISRFFSDPF